MKTNIKEVNEHINNLNNEVARLKELLNRAIDIAERLEKEGLSASQLIDLHYELDAVKNLAALAPAPEEPVSDWKCPHCGSTTGTWFSRVEPMGDICEDCGKAVDDEPVIKESLTTEPASTPTDLKQQNKENTVYLNDWRELGPAEVICEGDEYWFESNWHPALLWRGHKADKLFRFRTRRPLPNPKEELPPPDHLHAWMCLQESINLDIAGELQKLRDEIQKLKATVNKTTSNF